MGLLLAVDFRAWLRKQGREDLAIQIDCNWCWPALGAWARDSGLIGTELHAKFVAELTATSCTHDLYRYLRWVGRDADVLNAFIARRNWSYLQSYLHFCGFDDAVVAMLAEIEAEQAHA